MPSIEHPHTPMLCARCKAPLVATASVISDDCGHHTMGAGKGPTAHTKSSREFRCSVCGVPTDVDTGEYGEGRGFKGKPEIQTVINGDQEWKPIPPKITYVPRTEPGALIFMDGLPAPAVSGDRASATAAPAAPAATEPIPVQPAEPTATPAPVADSAPPARGNRRGHR